METPSDAILNLIDPSLRDREEASNNVLKEALTCPEMHTEKHILATCLDLIFIQNHPDRRSSGYDDDQMLDWGLHFGLITEEEAARVR